MKAKIIQIQADLFKLDIEHKEVNAKASKLLKLRNTDLKVGDIVEAKIYPDGFCYIEKRYERFNDLIRPSVANIDKAIVCVSVKEPDFNQNLLDRFLSVLFFNNIDVVILFTKWDLLMNNELDYLFDYYQSIGYECYKTTTKNKSVKDLILKIVENKICVITGQSGVGKSSLLNLVDENLKLETAEISLKLNRGKHTTRYTTLYKIGSGYIVDTPGFGNLDFIGMNEVDLSHSFVEIFEASKDCKYKGCLHDNEPHCHVKELVEKGIINKERYNNYLSFLKIVKQNRKY